MGWLALAGTLAGGYLGYKGQKSANQANLQIARENRAFHERMSNTAYRRAAVDLEGAGLNRILALGSPATSPAGNVAHMENEEGAGVASALSAAQVAVAHAQAKKLEEETYPLKVQNDAIRGTIDAVTPDGNGNVRRAVGDAVEKVRDVVTYPLGGEKPGWLEQIIPHGATKDPDRTTAKLNPVTPSMAWKIARAVQGQVKWVEMKRGEKVSKEYRDTLRKELTLRARRGENIERYYWSNLRRDK